MLAAKKPRLTITLLHGYRLRHVSGLIASIFTLSKFNKFMRIRSGQSIRHDPHAGNERMAFFIAA